MISKTQLEEFKKIYKKTTGEDISDAEALESAIKLLRLVEIVYNPLPQEDTENKKAL